MNSAGPRVGGFHDLRVRINPACCLLVLPETKQGRDRVVQCIKDPDRQLLLSRRAHFGHN